MSILLYITVEGIEYRVYKDTPLVDQSEGSIPNCLLIGQSTLHLFLKHYLQQYLHILHINLHI